MDVTRLIEKLDQVASRDSQGIKLGKAAILNAFRGLREDNDTLEFVRGLVKDRNERVAQQALDITILEKKLDDALSNVGSTRQKVGFTTEICATSLPEQDDNLSR